jgi:hypothetical protein
MPADSERGSDAEMLTRVPDILPAAIGSQHADAPLWPWSYRVAGALSSWPAVELYEAGALFDVVVSTGLTAQVLRGCRAVRGTDGGRVLAWGRLPLRGSLPVVEFSRGTFRRARLAVTPVSVTSWCWLATADALYDRVTVRHGETAVRYRVRGSRSRP